MKYRDDDIILVRSDNIFKFKNFIPSHQEYMYLKILNTGRILISRGNYLKAIFKLKNIENKNINDIKREFFNDYLNSLLDKVKEEHTAYQFNFQYKEDITLYSCSIYPCMVYDDCKSFDVIIRQNNRDSSDSTQFFTEL
jgi:hypothetical protein